MGTHLGNVRELKGTHMLRTFGQVLREEERGSESEIRALSTNNARRLRLPMFTWAVTVTAYHSHCS